MKKNIWLINHYATNMFFNKGGRHYWFAENLIENGYEPTILCANTRHGRGDTVVVPEGKYIRAVAGKVPFVFVKTVDYRSNDLQRVGNMLTFSLNLFQVAKEYAKIYRKPDLVLASSVHPLTLVSGVRIARKFRVPCICEIRDLWPESIIAYGLLKEGLIAELLYIGERWIYKKADKLIFTMEGGKDYIVEKGWDKKHGGPIDLGKIYHINNGVDLEAFDNNKRHCTIRDKDLEDESAFKVVYTGSIRLVNKVDKILEVAKLLKDQHVKFLLWGSGDQLADLKIRVEKEQIDNVIFKGGVHKKYIPYITTKAQLNIVLGENMPLFRFGGSMNKMFEYFASGKPILFTFKVGYSLVKRYQSGLELDDSRAETIADAILYFKNLDNKSYNQYCKNARKAAKNYSFKNLTKDLINIIDI